MSPIKEAAAKPAKAPPSSPPPATMPTTRAKRVSAKPVWANACTPCRPVAFRNRSQGSNTPVRAATSSADNRIGVTRAGSPSAGAGRCGDGRRTGRRDRHRQVVEKEPPPGPGPGAGVHRDGDPDRLRQPAQEHQRAAQRQQVDGDETPVLSQAQRVEARRVCSQPRQHHHHLRQHKYRRTAPRPSREIGGATGRRYFGSYRHHRSVGGGSGARFSYSSRTEAEASARVLVGADDPPGGAVQLDSDGFRSFRYTTP